MSFDDSLMPDSPTSRLTVRRQVCPKRGFPTSHRSNERRPEFQTSRRLWRAWAARPAFAGRRAGQRLQRCGHSPAPPSRSPYVSGRRRLWCKLAEGISESQGDDSLQPPEEPEIERFPLIRHAISDGILLKIFSNRSSGGVSRLGITAVP